MKKQKTKKMFVIFKTAIKPDIIIMEAVSSALRRVKVIIIPLAMFIFMLYNSKYYCSKFSIIQ